MFISFRRITVADLGPLGERISDWSNNRLKIWLSFVYSIFLRKLNFFHSPIFQFKPAGKSRGANSRVEPRVVETKQRDFQSPFGFVRYTAVASLILQTKLHLRNSWKLSFAVLASISSSNTPEPILFLGPFPIDPLDSFHACTLYARVVSKHCFKRKKVTKIDFKDHFRYFTSARMDYSELLHRQCKASRSK